MSDTTTRAVTPEQEARDMLERIGVDEAQAQSFSSGEVVELANLIAAAWRFTPEDVAAIRELLADYISDDEGPRGESWKSDELEALTAKVGTVADRLALLLAIVPPE